LGVEGAKMSSQNREENILHQTKLGFNVQAFLDERDQTDTRRVKRSLILQGYPHQYSFYGQVEDRDGEKHYKRIEVFSNTELGKTRLLELKEYFEEELPEYEYSLWAYNHDRLGVQLVKGYGPAVY